MDGPSEAFEVNELVLFSALRIGYRYQKADGGLFFKAGLTPLLGAVINRYIKNPRVFYASGFEPFVYPWIGIGIGYTLKN